MKSLWILAISVCLLACQGNTQEKVDMKTQKDSVSYSIGINIGKNLKAQSVEVNPTIVAAGLRDALGGGKTLLTDEQMQGVMTTFQQEMMGKQMAKAKELGEKNSKDGEAFLAENKKKEGVQVTASGLQYKILKAGTGRKPKETDTVSVNYRGTLIDGTEFDNSYKRGQPATFAISNVIKGWGEALQLMPLGSKWQVFVPAELAYGSHGAGQAIPPGATLIFEVELVSIK